MAKRQLRSSHRTRGPRILDAASIQSDPAWIALLRLQPAGLLRAGCAFKSVGACELRVERRGVRLDARAARMGSVVVWSRPDSSDESLEVAIAIQVTRACGSNNAESKLRLRGDDYRAASRSPSDALCRLCEPCRFGRRSKVRWLWLPASWWARKPERNVGLRSLVHTQTHSLALPRERVSAQQSG